jgi:hypothetical protein
MSEKKRRMRWGGETRGGRGDLSMEKAEGNVCEESGSEIFLLVWGGGFFYQLRQL